MLPDRLWKKEVLEEARGGRGLLLKMLLPLVLLAPLAFLSVPQAARAAGLAAGVLFVGVFGASVRLARARETGMLERLAVLPVSPRRLAAEYVGASALVDTAQLAVPALLIAASLALEPPFLYAAAVCFAAAVVGANALGVLVAIAAASPAEGHLFAILAVLGVAAVSVTGPGVVAAGPLGSLLPFHHLVLALSGTAAPGAASLAASASLTAGLLVLIVLATAPALFRPR